MSSRLDDLDEPFLRWAYLPLSYAFELMLKSRVIVLSNTTNIKALDKELKELGHNLITISQKLGPSELLNIGIKNIVPNINRKVGNYFVKTVDDEQISIEDFTKMRYDFETMRIVSRDEHKKIKTCTDILKKILNRISEANNKN